MSYLNPIPFKADQKSDEESSVLENHYFVHNAWLTSELLLQTARKIKVPVVLVQGRYDMVCPPASAIQVKEAIPHANLFLVTAGHSTREKGIFRSLRKAIASLVA